jgi:uncharacterized membrane protein
MKTLAGYFSVIVLGLWVGGMCLFTFVVTPVIFRSYPRDVAGEIVGKLFPSYFLFTLVVSAITLVLFVFFFPDQGSLSYRVAVALASLAVIVSLYVNFRLYPEARMVKQEVHSFETAAPDEPLKARFRRLHAQSAILNLFMIADGLALLIISLRVKK